MKENIKKNVNNIEECLGLLIEQNYLIDILQTDYFGKNNYSREEAWMLAWEYKRYQSLLSTIASQLRLIEKKLNDNLYPLIKSLKDINYEK